MKRAVYEPIGGLDERFGLGFFDDDDLAERARRAGFELAVAHDLFVHHFGSRTFAGNGIDAEALLEENARRFAAKWGHETPRGRRVALRPWDRRSGVSRRDAEAQNGKGADEEQISRPTSAVRAALRSRALRLCGNRFDRPGSQPDDDRPRRGG